MTAESPRRRRSIALLERIARASDRVFDRLRVPDAFTITDDEAIDASLEALRGHRYAVVVTFRRNGDPVPSPVWIAVDGNGFGYVKTAPYAGKVKRLRNDNRVLIAPSNVRGKPTAPAIRAAARVLPPDEWPRAEAALADAQGILRASFERLLGSRRELSAYIEMTPR